MNAQQQARGPDSGGVFAQGAQAWGHRRLKIMDLSESAQQPMVDPELGLGIVFNGAIYNHPELRRELEARGYRFYSHGDTEVLLKAYHAWGEDFVAGLDGHVRVRDLGARQRARAARSRPPGHQAADLRRRSRAGCAWPRRCRRCSQR